MWMRHDEPPAGPLPTRSAPARVPAPAPVPGSLHSWRDFDGGGTVPARDLVAWLPPASAGPGPFPVVYFQDGQNVFGPAASLAVPHADRTWGAVRTLEALAASGRPVIAVGVAHAGAARIHEYGPFVDPKHGGGGADAYVELLSERVRPAVDAAFPTVRGPRQTAIVGSSLGGVVALYALFRRPDVFGRCAALSVSAWFADHALEHWLGDRQSRGADRHPARIYLDTGRWERGRPGGLLPFHAGSWRYVRSVRRLHRRLRQLGYRDGRDLRLVLDRQGEHRESAWRRRLPGALEWLLDDLA